MSKKNRERRRERQEKKAKGPTPHHEAEAAAFLESFESQLKTSEPESWPGACSPCLARPDRVKERLADFAFEGKVGKPKLRSVEQDLANGPLGEIRDIKHWGMEEFLWHGKPGDSWNPIEAFLERNEAGFPPEAGEQLRRWKGARLGFFEIGPVADDLVTLREWDSVAGKECGEDFKAIALHIGGVGFYRNHLDWINLTYVAPWAPEQGVLCAMGYGITVNPEDAARYIPLLALRKPEAAIRPLPWKATPAAPHEFARIWRQRLWPEWLAERLEFPFQAITGTPTGEVRVCSVPGLLPSSPESFRDLGLYFEVELGRQQGATGATAVIPCDPLSGNGLALAEYRAYRAVVGPPRKADPVRIVHLADPESPAVLDPGELQPFQLRPPGGEATDGI